MELHLLLIFLLYLGTGAAAQEYPVFTALEGDDLTIRCNLTYVATTLETPCSTYFTFYQSMIARTAYCKEGGGLLSSTMYIYIPNPLFGVQTTGAFQGRTTLNSDDSLTITSVTTADNGPYVCGVFSDIDDSYQAARFHIRISTTTSTTTTPSMSSSTTKMENPPSGNTGNMDTDIDDIESPDDTEKDEQPKENESKENDDEGLNLALVIGCSVAGAVVLVVVVQVVLFKVLKISCIRPQKTRMTYNQAYHHRNTAPPEDEYNYIRDSTILPGNSGNTTTSGYANPVLTSASENGTNSGYESPIREAVSTGNNITSGYEHPDPTAANRSEPLGNMGDNTAPYDNSRPDILNTVTSSSYENALPITQAPSGGTYEPLRQTRRTENK